MDKIKSFKLFVNNNEKSENVKNIVRNTLLDNGFVENNNNYDLGIAIGGDGSFLRMVKNTNFNSDVYYVGINAGTLGFMQEVKIDEIDNFVSELKNNKYKIESIGIQETTVNYKESSSKFYSLNEIVIRDENLKVVKCDVKIDNDLLEKFLGDGLIITTSYGSTAHNLSYNGSIVWPTFSTLQITSIGPINNKVYNSYQNDSSGKTYIYTRDTQNNFYSYFESYKSYLVGLGVTDIIDVRMMSYAEAVGVGCSESSSSCPTYLSNQYYWIGSLYSEYNVWLINSDRHCFDNGRFYGNDAGVRPVVLISESSILVP